MSRSETGISAFNETDAKEFVEHYPDIPEDLALRIYTSRLIGGNPDLVLHGGGNTSVKLNQRNIFKKNQSRRGERTIQYSEKKKFDTQLCLVNLD